MQCPPRPARLPSIKGLVVHTTSNNCSMDVLKITLFIALLFAAAAVNAEPISNRGYLGHGRPGGYHRPPIHGGFHRPPIHGGHGGRGGGFGGYGGGHRG